MFKIDFSLLNNDELNQLANKSLQGNPDDWQKYIWEFVAQLCNPAIQSISIFTSGSTGVSRQIVHTKQAIFNSAQMTCNALGLEQGNAALLSLPANKVGGMMMIARSFISKMNLCCIKPTSNPFNEIRSDLKIDFVAFTPMQFYAVMNDVDAFKKASGISKIILGGQEVDSKLAQRIRDMQNEVYLTFGMTETISHIALKRLNGKSPDNYFTLLPDVKISIDERSCMIVDAPKLGCNHLATNDIISIVAGNKFEWLGRWDNVINSGGVKIYPEEIEHLLQPYISNPFFIAGLPDNKLGQKVVMIIEAEKISDAQNTEFLNAFAYLEKIKRPKEIWFAKTFVRTENGKIKRAESLKNLHFKLSD